MAPGSDEYSWLFEGWLFAVSNNAFWDIDGGPFACVPGRGTLALIDRNGDHLSQDGHINVWSRSG